MMVSKPSGPLTSPTGPYMQGEVESAAGKKEVFLLHIVPTADGIRWKVDWLHRSTAANTGQGAVQIRFVTRDVQGAFDRAITEGAEAVRPPQTKPWGQDVAYVRDPDGNLVEIASPAGPA